MRNILFSFFLTSLLSLSAFAARGGGGGGGGGNHSMEFGFGFATASQDDVNTWLVANSGQQLGGATEFSFSYLYRFSGTIFSLNIRPAYFDQRNTGATNASMTALTFMPMLRLTPLENSFLKFFLQIGMGFGSLTGSIAKSGANASFTGSAFGMQLGLGADFCFAPSHCMTIEGNYRYMPVPRSVIGTIAGTLGNGMTGVGELEYNNADVQNTLSGVQGLIGYTINF